MTDPIEFSTTLSEDDWDKTVGGWRCDALRIPAAEIAGLYVGGRKADPKEFARDGFMVRWATSPQPSAVAVRIRLAADLTSLEDQRLKLEEKKHEVETRWRKYTLAAALFTAILGSATTLVVARTTAAKGTPPTPGAAVDPVACRDSLVRLKAIAGVQNQTVDNLRTAVQFHSAACAGMGEP